MVTQHGKPMFTKVCTEGRLILEFTFDDLMRIKTWHFTIRQYRELVPRSILAMHAQDPQVLDQLSKNITRMGLTNFTLNYLRLCVILEPMQELMSRHKTYNLSPRDCLKTCLFQKWQRMVAPPAEPTRQPTTKRRKRKNSTSSTSNSSAGNTANSTGSKKKTPAANLSLSSQVPKETGGPNGPPPDQRQYSPIPSQESLSCPSEDKIFARLPRHFIELASASGNTPLRLQKHRAQPGLLW
uniref:LIM domain binding 2 n=1 Tax=Felis catus TaxID=9685 RepID=A0ABI7XR97_FELCA